MTINKMTFKLFGKRESVFRVFKDGELVHVAESLEAAEAWIAAQ